jgi:hypothetical protein
VRFREVFRSNFVRRAHRRGGAQCPRKARENEPLEFRVRIVLPFVVTATFFTDNVTTELMIPGSSIITGQSFESLFPKEV